MRLIIESLCAIIIMAGILGGIVFYVGVGSGLIDPHRLHKAITGKLDYPDNLFGGGK